MKKANICIRSNAKQAKVPLWAIADKLNLSEVAFLRHLRYELPDEEKERIRTIIVELAQEGE